MVIDFRSRAPYKSFIAPFLFDKDSLKLYSEWYNLPMAKSALNLSLDEYINDMERYGIDKAVSLVRKATGGTNGDLVDLINLYPDKIIGIACIEPSDSFDEICAEIDQYVLNGPCVGVTVEPGFSPEPMALDDPRILPILKYCESKNIPVVLAFGDRNYPAMRLWNATMLDNIAEACPDLKITIFHGGWPNIQEVFWIAMSRSNVWISVDACMLDAMPGCIDYQKAANYLLQDKIIFASAYPFFDMGAVKDEFIKLLRPEVVDKVMYKNALDALGLTEKEIKK